MEICGIAVITSLFAGALISNLGSISITVFAQDSQNATQQQQQVAGYRTCRHTELHTKPKNVSTGMGLNTTSSSPGELREKCNNSPMALILSNSLKG